MELIQLLNASTNASLKFVQLVNGRDTIIEPDDFSIMLNTHMFNYINHEQIPLKFYENLNIYFYIKIITLAINKITRILLTFILMNSDMPI